MIQWTILILVVFEKFYKKKKHPTFEVTKQFKNTEEYITQIIRLFHSYLLLCSFPLFLFTVD